MEKKELLNPNTDFENVDVNVLEEQLDLQIFGINCPSNLNRIGDNYYIISENKGKWEKNEKGDLVKLPERKVIASTSVGIQVLDTKVGAVVGFTNVSNAVIKRARRVNLFGIENTSTGAIYKIELTSGDVIVAENDTLLPQLTQKYGVRSQYQDSIIHLIEVMSKSQPIEDLFYCFGPWYIDGKIRYASASGYNPPWKEQTRWKVELDIETTREVKKNALNIISKFVDCYADPKKPSRVLSYALISALCQAIKAKTSYFPHHIIEGKESSGKSTLLDFIRLLYVADWADPTPKGEYQARRLLAQTTIPALIHEGRDIFAQQYNKGASGELEILHTAATTGVLRTAGGRQHGGTFLATRTAIIATNASLNLLPYQADKFITTTISKKEGLDTARSRGYTPRTIPENIRMVLPVIMKEALEVLDSLMPSIFEDLRMGDREDIQRKIIEWGYKAWCKLYERYELVPFVQPILNEEQKSESYEEKYRIHLNAHIAKRLAEVRIEQPLPITREKTQSDYIRENLDTFNKNEFLYTADPDDKVHILCTTGFLGKFSTIAERDYKLPYLGWQRLVELLNMKETSVKINGKKVHCLKYEYKSLENKVEAVSETPT